MANAKANYVSLVAYAQLLCDTLTLESLLSVLQRLNQKSRVPAKCSSTFMVFAEKQSLQNCNDLVKTGSLMYSIFSRRGMQSIIKTMGPMKSAFIQHAVGIMLQWKSDCLIRILGENPI